MVRHKGQLYNKSFLTMTEWDILSTLIHYLWLLLNLILLFYQKWKKEAVDMNQLLEDAYKAAQKVKN